MKHCPCWTSATWQDGLTKPRPPQFFGWHGSQSCFTKQHSFLYFTAVLLLSPRTEHLHFSSQRALLVLTDNNHNVKWLFSIEKQCLQLDIRKQMSEDPAVFTYITASEMLSGRNWACCTDRKVGPCKALKKGFVVILFIWSLAVLTRLIQYQFWYWLIKITAFFLPAGLQTNGFQECPLQYHTLGDEIW